MPGSEGNSFQAGAQGAAEPQPSFNISHTPESREQPGGSFKLCCMGQNQRNSPMELSSLSTAEFEQGWDGAMKQQPPPPGKVPGRSAGSTSKKSANGRKRRCRAAPALPANPPCPQGGEAEAGPGPPRRLAFTLPPPRRLLWLFSFEPGHSALPRFLLASCLFTASACGKISITHWTDRAAKKRGKKKKKTHRTTQHPTILRFSGSLIQK